MADATVIWQRLLAEGLVEGEPPAPPEPATPWPVRLLAGAGAWLATPLLLGFLALLLGDLALRESSGLVLGPILMLAPLTWLRDPARGEFSRQAAGVVSLAGLALFVVGLAFGARLAPDGVALAVLVAAVPVFALSREPVHRFGIALAGLVAACWLIAGGLGMHRLVLLQPLLAWATLLVWLAWTRHCTARPFWRLALPPLAWALALAASVLVVWSPSWQPAADGLPWSAWLASRYAAAAVLPGTALLLAWPRRREVPAWRLLAWVLAAVVLSWLWLPAPGVTFTLAMMLVAFATGQVVLLALAILALAVYLVAYYFQLAVPLLDKAHALLLAGGVLLAAHLLLRPRAPRGEARP